MSSGVLVSRVPEDAWIREAPAILMIVFGLRGRRGSADTPFGDFFGYRPIRTPDLCDYRVFNVTRCSFFYCARQKPLAE